MPMKTSTKLVKVLLTNIAIAVAISLTASYIGVSGAGVPAEAFMPAFLGTSAANIGMSYVISFFVGWFIPAEKLGFGFAMKCGLKPTDGLKFGATLNVVVNTIYVAFNSVILTYVNACVMNGAPLAAYPAAFMSSILQCWIVGYVVSLFWAPQCEKWARAICKVSRAPDALGALLPGRHARLFCIVLAAAFALTFEPCPQGPSAQRAGPSRLGRT